MRIERFAGDEEPHNFARTFKDRINTAISQKSFHGDWRLTPSGQRLRRLIAATATYLHRVVGNLPGHFRRPHFAHGCFNAQIERFTIEQRRAEERHRFHRENVARHLRNFPRDGGMLTDRHAPLNAFARPSSRDFEQPFGNTHTRGR